MGWTIYRAECTMWLMSRPDLQSKRNYRLELARSRHLPEYISPSRRRHPPAGTMSLHRPQAMQRPRSQAIRFASRPISTSSGSLAFRTASIFFKARRVAFRHALRFPKTYIPLRRFFQPLNASATKTMRPIQAEAASIERWWCGHSFEERISTTLRLRKNSPSTIAWTLSVTPGCSRSNSVSKAARTINSGLWAGRPLGCVSRSFIGSSLGGRNYPRVKIYYEPLGQPQRVSHRLGIGHRCARKCSVPTWALSAAANDEIRGASLGPPSGVSGAKITKSCLAAGRAGTGPRWRLTRLRAAADCSRSVTG